MELAAFLKMEYYEIKNYILYNKIRVLNVLFLFTLGFCLDFSPPHYQEFFENDPLLSHQLKSNTVSTIQVYIITYLLPMIYFIYANSFENISSFGIGDLLINFNESYSSCLVVTCFLKSFIGRPRPNFFALCKYVTTSHSPHLRIGSVKNCLGKISDIYESQKSFPSGHTSLSFAGLFYTCLVTKSFYPILPAFFIAATRLRDFWHHYSDVAAGMVVGTIISGLLYLYHIEKLRQKHLYQNSNPDDIDFYQIV